jgi:NTE family protein
MKYRIALLLFTIVTCSRAQQIKNLVFEGAGIRGIAYSGVVRELAEKNILQGIERVGGTSAGAIAALTISLGYSGDEMEKIISKMRLQKFNDGRFFFVGGFSRLNRNYGWYRGRAFVSWLEEIIEAKTGDSEITFGQLSMKGFKDLYVTGTSLTRQRMLVFSAETYPDMKIKDAVRISMSIPLYFEAVCIDSSGQVLHCRKSRDVSDLMVDGGLTGNFPIAIFDSLTDSGERILNRSTLGFRIDTPDQIEFDKAAKGLAPFRIAHFRNYITAFYSYAIENLNRQSLSPEDWSRTVSVSSGNIGPKIKKLSTEEKETLIRNGRNAVAQFLTKK